MSLYAVQDNVGNYWDFDNRGFHSPQNNARRNTTFNLDLADAIVQMNGGHVVELVDAPEKIVVSEEEAILLATLSDGGLMPVSELSYFVRHSEQLPEKESIEREDRLIRAYVNGWTVEKPKRYVLPMPGTDYHNIQMHGNAQYYAIKGTGNWRPDAIALGTDDAVKHGYTVTQADIDAAPDWVKAIKPVEVTDDGIR